MSNENIEWPTFDPDKLPSDATLRAETETDLKLFEAGASPDEIAQIRERVRKMTKESRQNRDQEGGND